MNDALGSDSGTVKICMFGGFAMNTKPQGIETNEDVVRYRDAFDAAILALKHPSEADVLICHALGVAL